MGLLRKLQVLNLQTNKLNFLPGPFDNLVGLKELYLSSNFLEVKPWDKHFFTVSLLTFVPADTQAFPHELYGFSALTVLDLGHNRCAISVSGEVNGMVSER